MSVSRRQLLKMAGSAALGPALSSRLLASQEPLVPADKGLSRAWIADLTKRGAPRVITDPKALKNIGMPVGGICCGQVYLGGDGRLWHWDIFGAPKPYPYITSGGHYANPMVPESEFLSRLTIGFIPERPSITGSQQLIELSEFSSIEFEGHYPEARITLRKEGLPIEVEVYAQSPFIPLAVDHSNLPIIKYTVRVRYLGEGQPTISLQHTCTNPVGRFSGFSEIVRPADRVVTVGGARTVLYEGKVHLSPASSRANVDLADWQDGTYGEWKSEGTAFGTGPVDREKLPERLSPAKPRRKFFVNTHEARSGEDSPTADRHVGTLTSPKFKIQHRYLNFWIGGGNHSGETCVNLIVDGKVELTETGRDSSVLRGVSWNVERYFDKEATLQIVDKHVGGWGHISLDWPHLSESPLPPSVAPDRLPDFGSFIVVLRHVTEEKADCADAAGQDNFPEYASAFGLASGKVGEEKSVTFEAHIAYYFPNYGDAHAEFRAMKDFDKLKRHYATRFKDAAEVAQYAIDKDAKIFGAAKLWAETWYDSTLPYWFLERTLIPVDCLQTQTAHRFDNGRFYGWEGIYCCAGTCQHVWNYAQASARLFPELERDTRERVDYGIAYQEDGTLGYRAETAMHIAHDGQAGTILRTYREHTTSPDDAFLKRIWPRVKKSIERLIQDDKGRDGILDGWQYNTLDSAWYGEIAWLSSLYLAALRAGQAMANEMGDREFEAELAMIIRRGQRNLPDRLFNGEYFIQKRDPAHPEAPGHGIGCHIDQVFGESFLHMIGLEPVLDRDKVRSALRSLWKYNFVPDAGAYRKKIEKIIPGGRWYAMDGEAGLLMSTFPKGEAELAPGKGNPTWMVGYFNECMNGFEYQVAAHMIAEGMLTEGLAIVKALDERYDASKRNPYNEIECSDHYSRSMAAYGCFLTICGFAFHGPKGHIRFAPKLRPEDFRAPFTAAEGWGTYAQKVDMSRMEATLKVKWGSLRLRSIELEWPFDSPLQNVNVRMGGKLLPATLQQSGRRLEITLERDLVATEGKAVILTLNA